MQDKITHDHICCQCGFILTITFYLLFLFVLCICERYYTTQREIISIIDLTRFSLRHLEVVVTIVTIISLTPVSNLYTNYRCKLAIYLQLHGLPRPPNVADDWILSFEIMTKTDDIEDNEVLIAGDLNFNLHQRYISSNWVHLKNVFKTGMSLIVVLKTPCQHYCNRKSYTFTTVPLSDWCLTPCSEHHFNNKYYTDIGAVTIIYLNLRSI